MAEYNPSKIIKDGNTYNFRDDTKIPLAGSNAISGDLIPATTDAYDLGGSRYQWNKAYIKSYYYNGVQWGLDKANVWTGTQSFTSAFTRQEGTASAHGYVIKARFVRGSAPSTVTNLTFRWLDSNDNILGFLDFVATSSTYAARLNLRTENNGTQVAESIQLETDLTGSYFSFNPLSNGNVDLGSSTNKWKSFNGINPGALSLPSSTYINVDTTNWDLTCQNELMGSFTPTADGWLMLHVANSGPSEVNFWVIGGVIRINNKSTLNTSDNNNFNMITIPVEKDVTYNIYGNASEYVAGRSIAYCRFMPCRGNI